MGAAPRGRRGPVLARADERHDGDAHPPRRQREGLDRRAEPGAGALLRPDRRDVRLRTGRARGRRGGGRLPGANGAARGRSRAVPSGASPGVRRTAEARAGGTSLAGEVAPPGRRDGGRAAPPRCRGPARRLRHRPAPRGAAGAGGRCPGRVPRSRRRAGRAGGSARLGRRRPVGVPRGDLRPRRAGGPRLRNPGRHGGRGRRAGAGRRVVRGLGRPSRRSARRRGAAGGDPAGEGPPTCRSTEG